MTASDPGRSLCHHAGGGRDTPGGVAHLADNRRLIVRRALLATAVGGVIPIPVLDDYFAGRVRAGMLAEVAERRRVDLAPGSADLLGDPREGNSVRNATLTAATLIALKLAWRKFFALLAIGRRAEEMATSSQLGMVFDHYCAKVHVGAGVDRAQAAMLRQVIFNSLAESERRHSWWPSTKAARCWAVPSWRRPNWLERSHSAGG